MKKSVGLRVKTPIRKGGEWSRDCNVGEIGQGKFRGEEAVELWRSEPYETGQVV